LAGAGAEEPGGARAGTGGPATGANGGVFWCLDEGEAYEPLAAPEGVYARIPTAAGHEIASLWIPSLATLAEMAAAAAAPAPNNNDIVSAPASADAGAGACASANSSAVSAVLAASGAALPHLRQRSRATILFSHGNAADLGAMKPQLLRLARRLNVNVFAYDYSGYGLSGGRATPRNTLADAEAALLHLRKMYPQWSEHVIAYGQSLGSAPTVHLSAKYPHLIAGVVVHSGLMSLLRCVRPGLETTHFFDIFPNVDLIAQVRAPVFVIHGSQDRDIPRRHGEQLVLRAQTPYKPWFAVNAGHNNVESKYASLYEAKLDEFIGDVVAGQAAGRFTREECLASMGMGADGAPLAGPGALSMNMSSVSGVGNGNGSNSNGAGGRSGSARRGGAGDKYGVDADAGEAKMSV